ncbi:MAG: hypothetical protein H7Y33_11610, partial [Cytophagales bacterium]|nr:hypothetical protein [Rhizobacter sp.]
MPTIVQTVNGKVTGLWGSALRRTPSGKLLALKMGDEVHKGDVILTTQDGIVQLTPDPDAPRVAATQPSTDIDRVIAELNQPDALTAPAAGLNGGDGSGLLPALRVGRISEDITPASFVQANDNAAPRLTEDRRPPEAQSAANAPVNALPSASSATMSVNEDATLPISLVGQDSDGNVTRVTVTSIPAGSTLLLADGVTPVLAGQTLTAAQASTLLFRPSPDFNGGNAVTFTVTDNQGGVSAPATVQINVLAVNDPPVATSGIARAGPEGTPIAVGLGGTDIDGTIAGVTVTSAPANGSLFLADGVTPVVPGTTLTTAAAASLVFRPAPGFT